MRKNKSNTRFEIRNLIEGLNHPDYITNTYSDIGIESLAILRGVFKVDDSILGDYFAKILSKRPYLIRDKKVLDLGCGCGILGIVCAINGAKQVCFSDINPNAIRNCKINSTLLNLDNVTYNIGNLFDGIPLNDGFDLIIFNSPVIKGNPKNYLERAFIREDKLISDFYKNYSKHLNRGGIVLLPGSSEFNDHTSPLNMAKTLSLNYKIIDLEEKDDGNYKYIVLIKAK